MVLTAAVPGGREVRALRRRFEHRHASSSGRTATVVLTILGLYVGGGVGWWLLTLPVGLPACGDPAATAPCSPAWGWLVVAVAAALGTATARALGPVTCAAEKQFWLLSTPIDRGAFLRPTVAAGLLAGAVAGAVAGRLAAFVAAPADRVSFVLVAAALGVGAVALPVLVQCRILAPAPVTVLIRVCPVVGAAAAVAGVAGVAVPPPGPAVAAGTWAAGALLGAVALVSCGRIGAPEWATAAETTTALSVSATALDPAPLFDLVERRRWLRRASRRSRALPHTRISALVGSDLLRLTRRPAPTALAFAGVLGSAAVAAVVPAPAAAVLHLAAVFTVATVSAAGLREVCREPDFAGLLGMGDRQLRLSLSVFPGAVATVAAAVTALASDVSTVSVTIGLVGGCAAAYRLRTRPPIGYDGLNLVTAVGQLPVDLLRQWCRGPDLLVASAWLAAVLA